MHFLRNFSEQCGHCCLGVGDCLLVELSGDRGNKIACCLALLQVAAELFAARFALATTTASGRPAGPRELWERTGLALDIRVSPTTILPLTYKRRVQYLVVVIKAAGILVFKQP